MLKKLMISLFVSAICTNVYAVKYDFSSEKMQLNDYFHDITKGQKAISDLKNLSDNKETLNKIDANFGSQLFQSSDFTQFNQQIIKNNVTNKEKITKEEKPVKTEKEKEFEEQERKIKVIDERVTDVNNKIYQRTGKTTCWNEAGKYHNVDPWLLFSIAYVESGFDPNAIGKNKNGTYDIGLMQINNKVWLPILKKKGITEKMLKDPCLSVYVGAWILKQNIDQYGYSAKAIGAYNSRTPSKNRAYAKKVYNAYYKFIKLYHNKNQK